jgi:hypothetical protein
LYLLLPLLGGALVHGMCWKYHWLSFLVHPLDGGATFQGKRLFGQNKTWRGPVTVALGAALVLELQVRVLHQWPPVAVLELFEYPSVQGWVLGALVGTAAELAELPNSFVKRQLGITPGGTRRGPWAVLFYLWDQIDVLLGAWLVFAAVVQVSAVRVLLSVLVVLAIHPLTTVVGYLLGMRATMR